MNPRKYYDSEMALYNHVKYYTPKTWAVNISNVDFVPMWDADEYQNMKNGIFSDTIKWYEREAINDFFVHLKEEEEYVALSS